MLDFQGIRAEQLPPPALERPDIGLVIGGDALEIRHRAHQLLGNVVLIAFHLEQDPEEIDQGADSLGQRLLLLNDGAFGLGHGFAFGDGAENALGERGAEAIASNRPGLGQFFRGFRAARGDIEKDVVAQDAVAWHVAFLGHALAPCGQSLQDAKEAGARPPEFDAPPGLRGIDRVGRGRGQHRHFFVEPMGPAVALEPMGQFFVRDTQVGDVRQRILQLFIR